MPRIEISPEQEKAVVDWIVKHGGVKVTDIAKPSIFRQHQDTGVYVIGENPPIVIANRSTEVELSNGVKRKGIPQNVLIVGYRQLNQMRRESVEVE